VQRANAGTASRASARLAAGKKAAEDADAGKKGQGTPPATPPAAPARGNKAKDSGKKDNGKKNPPARGRKETETKESKAAKKRETAVEDKPAKRARVVSAPEVEFVSERRGTKRPTEDRENVQAPQKRKKEEDDDGFWRMGGKAGFEFGVEVGAAKRGEALQKEHNNEVKVMYQAQVTALTKAYEGALDRLAQAATSPFAAHPPPPPAVARVVTVDDVIKAIFTDSGSSQLAPLADCFRNLEVVGKDLQDLTKIYTYLPAGGISDRQKDILQRVVDNLKATGRL
jgi:hypothetical protein